jgi:hypothetical protein
MATYLQGVTDYIPQFQPFQPDLNFYANILQTKQTQYDTNWKALNNMYGKLYHADLTREGNINKRDSYLKQAEFDLKRISQMDLSLEQNVNQATQIFKPLYEDKGLVKDMAWTKNYMMERSKGESFKNAYDEKLQDRYWDVGLRELDYKRDEFKKADDASAMNFGNATYTPYVNAMEVAQDVAKEAGLSIESVNFSPDGRWIIKNKNGEQLIEPLSKLFEARLGNDPAIQAVYNTQAYVDRKDYAKSNAALFNNDENAAEMKYLEDKFTILKRQNELRYKGLQAQNTVYNSKIEDLKKQIANKTANPGTELQLAQLEMNRDINAKVLASVEQQGKTLNNGMSSTPSTEGGFRNPYGDLNTLRYKVDAGVASMLMSKDLNEAAQIFAYKDAKTDLESNPYKVMEEKHMYNLREIGAKEASAKRVAQYKSNLAKKEALDKWLVEERGTHTWEAITDANGNIIGRVAKEKENETTGVTITDTDGNVTNEINMLDFANQVRKDQFIPVKNYFQSALPLMATLVGNNKMTKEQAANILQEQLLAVDRYEKGKDYFAQMSAYLPNVDASQSHILTKDLRTKYNVKSGISLYEAVKNGTIPFKEAAALLGTFDDKVYSEISRESRDLLKGMSTRTGATELKVDNMSNRLNEFISQNPNLSEIQVNGKPTPLYAAVRKNSAALSGFNEYDKKADEWRKDAANGVKAEMIRLNPTLKGPTTVSDFVKSQLDPTNYSPSNSIPDYLFDEFGNIKSEADFYKSVPDAIKNKYVTTTKVIAPRETDYRAPAYYEGARNRPARTVNIAYAPGKYPVNSSSYSDDLNYNKLVEKANKAFTKSDVIKNAPPGIDAITDAGTGTFTNKMKYYQVNTKSMGPVAAKGYEMLSVLNNLDLGDTKNIRVSTFGSSKSAWDHGHVSEGKDVPLARQILTDLQDAKGKYTKDNTLTEFGIAYKPISAGDIKYSGVILKLPDAYIKSLNISDEKKAELQQNGVQFMLPKEQISGTTLYKESTKDPISAIIDYTGKPYVYTDPLNSKNKLTVSKNDFGISPYSIEITNGVYDPNTNTEIENRLVDYETSYGNDLTNFIFNDIVGEGGYFDQIRAINNYNYNNR